MRVSEIRVNQIRVNQGLGVPAKSKCNALRFLMKKNKFCSIDEYFFNPFFKGSKVICKRGKTFFFHRKSEVLHLLFAGT